MQVLVSISSCRLIPHYAPKGAWLSKPSVSTSVRRLFAKIRSMSEMGILNNHLLEHFAINAHYRVPPKWALMSFRLKNSNPRTPIVTDMRKNDAVTSVATPKLWMVTIPLLGVVEARTTMRMTDETAAIQSRPWKTSIEKRDQGCNRNNPTPVASPHNDMPTSRTARSFSRSITRPVTAQSKATPLNPVTTPPARFSCWEACSSPVARIGPFGVNEFYQKGCQEESSASTGGEMFSRDPAHWN